MLEHVKIFLSQCFLAIHHASCCHHLDVGNVQSLLHGILHRPAICIVRHAMMEIDDRACGIRERDSERVACLGMYSIIGIVIHLVTDGALVEECDILHHNQFACDVTFHAGYCVEGIVPTLLIDGTIDLTLCLERFVGEIICLKEKPVAGEHYNI